MLSEARGAVVRDYTAAPFRTAAEIAQSLLSVDPSGATGSPKTLKSNWSEFLTRYDWQLFATFTFKEETHPESAVKAFRHWACEMDKSNGYRHRSRTTYNRRCTWARGLEWQKRGVLHFHALIGNLPYERTSQAQRLLLSAQWLGMGNTGFAKVDAFDGRGEAGAYIAKYCAKGGEIDLSPNLALPDLVGVAERR